VPVGRERKTNGRRATPGKFVMVKDKVAFGPMVTGFVPRSVRMISALLVWGMATAPAANASKETSLEESRVGAVELSVSVLVVSVFMVAVLFRFAVHYYSERADLFGFMRELSSPEKAKEF